MTRRRDDSGQVGGWEVIPFGLLVFVVGTLLLVNAWAVVDARLVVGDSAREGARAYVHEDTEQAARRAADRAIHASLDGRGQHHRQITIDPIDVEPRFERCARVMVTVHEHVPAIVLPFIGGFGHGFTVTGSQRELIDPFRSGLDEGSACED